MLGPFEGNHRFRIIRLLGAGGMGVVYEAHDVERNLRVALKTVQAAHPGALQRFKREFRALTDLAHPNLASLYELFIDDAVPFFTMELVAGVDFLSYIRQLDAPVRADPEASTVSGDSRNLVAAGDAVATDPIGHAGTSPAIGRRYALDFARLRDALRQLALGMHALHGSGKLHRDLKPSNVLVTRAGRVVLLDFGLVADIDPSGAHGTELDALAGTVEYMSPEQAACTEIAEPTDWYAFGTMLYEALTERLPYEGPRIKILVDKNECDPEPPSRFFADVPADLERLAMDLLRRDPAARPSGRRVLEALGVERATVSVSVGRSSAHATATAPFLGREEQVVALARAFERVLQGNSATVHVRGSSGMGKTAFVKHAIDEMSRVRDEVVVLSGRCYEQESLAFKALDSAIDSLSRHLRSMRREQVEPLLPRHAHALERVFPVLRRVEGIATAPGRGAGDRVDPHELRRRAFAALRDMLTRMAMRSPLIVWIDDLQWGDVDSGMLLGELLRPPDPPPFLLIVSYRSEADVDVGCLGALRRVEEATSTVTLDVQALPHAEARKLAAMLLASKESSDELVESIASESSGNPFLLSELVRFHQSGVGLRRSLSGKLHLEDVIEARLSQFSPGARRVLELVAIAGRPLALEVAVAASELEAPAARAAIAQLRSAQLLRSARAKEQEALDTFHDRIRETAIKLLDPEATTQRHARLVAAMAASRNPDPEQLAVHSLGAGDRVSAGEHAERAGEQAVSLLAFDRGAEWYARALEWRPVDGPAAGELRRRRADALANAGRGAEAGREYLEAARLRQGTDDAELRQRASEQFLTIGCMDEGIDVVRSVLEGLGERYPGTTARTLLLFVLTSILVRLRGFGFRSTPGNAVNPRELHRVDTFRSAEKGLIFTDTLRGRYFSNRATLAALRVGEPNRVFVSLGHTLMNVSASGTRSLPRAQKLERLVDDLAHQLNNPHRNAQRNFSVGWSRYLLGNFERGFELLDKADQQFRELAEVSYWERDSSRIFLISCLWFLGRVRELGSRVAEYGEDAVRRGDGYMNAFLASGYANASWLAADDPARCIREATTVFERWPIVANDLQRYYAIVACSQADLYLGDAASALARIDDSWRRLYWGILAHVQLSRVQALHLRARAVVGVLASSPDDLALRRDAERSVRRISRERFPCARAMAGSLEASLELLGGRRESAAARFAEAAKLFDEVSMALYAAACRYREGEVRGGEQGNALREAAETFMRAETIKNPQRMVDMLVPTRPKGNEP